MNGSRVGLARMGITLGRVGMCPGWDGFKWVLLTRSWQAYVVEGMTPDWIKSRVPSGFNDCGKLTWLKSSTVSIFKKS